MSVDVEFVFRQEYSRAVAVLVRVFGDIDLAEEAVQDAFTVAVQRWPSEGLPPSPAGWIITTARNRAINRLRREASRDDRHVQAMLLNAEDEPADDGRGARRQAAADLYLLPSGPGAERTGGAHLTPAGWIDDRRDRPSIPGARVDHGPTPGARQSQDPRGAHPLPRAQRGGPAGAPARRPGRRVPDLQRRLHGQFRRAIIRDDLCAEAIRLGRLLVELMPDEPEVLGLLG